MLGHRVPPEGVDRTSERRRKLAWKHHETPKGDHRLGLLKVTRIPRYTGSTGYARSTLDGNFGAGFVSCFHLEMFGARSHIVVIAKDIGP